MTAKMRHIKDNLTGRSSLAQNATRVLEKSYDAEHISMEITY